MRGDDIFKLKLEVRVYKRRKGSAVTVYFSPLPSSSDIYYYVILRLYMVTVNYYRMCILRRRIVISN